MDEPGRRFAARWSAPNHRAPLSFRDLAARSPLAGCARADPRDRGRGRRDARRELAWRDPRRWVLRAPGHRARGPREPRLRDHGRDPARDARREHVGVAKPVFAPGLQFGIKKVLRLGIILVGIRLSFLDVMKLGAWGVPVVLVLIAVAIFLTRALGRRLGVTRPARDARRRVDRDLRRHRDGRRRADDRRGRPRGRLHDRERHPVRDRRDVRLPLRRPRALRGDVRASAGLFLGTSIHETAQVMGAALSYRKSSTTKPR